MRVYIQDCRACGYCAPGVRDFFQRCGLDFRDFVLNGIDAEALAELGDAMSRQAILKAEKRARDGQQ